MKKKLEISDLIEYFHKTIKPEEQNKIGLEYELFCMDNVTNQRIAYWGHRGIAEILKFIFEKIGGHLMCEEGNIVGVESEEFSITIEPGCQIESSFRPSKSLFEQEKLLDSYLDLLQLVQNKFNVFFWATGVDSKHDVESVDWIPKKRYFIMKQYFLKRGKLAHYMMKMTASMHISIDYNSESDAFYKFNRAIDLYKIFYENVASKNINNELTRFKIWENTDDERTGIPFFMGKPIETFSDYINYALDIPLIFFVKNACFYPLKNRKTFRDYMKDGIDNYFPTIKDWELHLNSIFPVVRLNHTAIELRFFDSGDRDTVISNIALINTFFYNDIKINLPDNLPELYFFAKKSLA